MFAGELVIRTKTSQDTAQQRGIICAFFYISCITWKLR
jgi:hypothetical protein